ncbi:MAG: hypothetical protein HY700_15785 [Gemmatimonadetes bacterium]|nr:hypothetical protein [Gemmatimonadota bacterium]
MRSPAAVVLLLSLVPALAGGQDQPEQIPAIKRKPYTVGGFLETRPTVLWLDTGAALYQLRWHDSAGKHTTTQLNQQFLLDAALRRGAWSFNSRSVVDVDQAGDWSAHATSYEANLSFKPSPSFTLDLGKKRQTWGKGYVWNPVAFVDRPKNPDDPTLAQEGFLVLAADYIRSFDGPLQTVSVTPVLIPVYRHLNAAYGRTGRVNAAGKLYLLLYDTDIDLLFLAGGSRPSRVGFDLSRNITSNFEVHGELAFIHDRIRSTVDGQGQMSQTVGDATSYLLGLRYLTRSETTLILDYYHAGTGFTTAEMRDFFAFVGTAYDRYLASGDAARLTQAAKAAELGYGGINPMRDYAYLRVSQPDAFGVLYFTPAAYSVFNLADRSFSLTQEMMYKLFTNLELRSQVNLITGARGTEFGDKQGNVRVELRVRYYF